MVRNAAGTTGPAGVGVSPWGRMVHTPAPAMMTTATRITIKRCVVRCMASEP